MNFESSRLRRIALWAGGAVATALLAAACGGGSLVNAFAPRRIIAFGDEASVIASDGRKFTVNALDANGALLCQNNPNWVQYLTQSFRLPFPQCNPDNRAAPSVQRAGAGAKVADLAAQVDAQLAADGFSDKDLATILIGANDVIEQYALYPGQSEAALAATLEARGSEIAAQVHRITGAGGKVIVSTLPDQGLTPFALAERAANPGGVDRAALLTRLTDRLNAKLRVGLLNDSGRDVGLILGDQLVQIDVKFPSTSASLTNVIDAACTTASALDCSSATLVQGAQASAGAAYLWADARQLGATAQRQLGIEADRRARNNPF